jgi:hypothetical protein
MSFCKLSNEYKKQGFTLIDNAFLLHFMPSADAVDVKVYLYGLTLAMLSDGEQNSLERLSLGLKLPEERIMSAFKYWQEKGLVSITATHPLSIVFNSPKTPQLPIIKYNAKEYSAFVEETARLFPDRVLTPNELTEFIELIRIYKIDVNALLMIMKYCIDYKEGKVSTSYILAVANDWIKKGLTDVEQVNEHICGLEANSEAVRMILKALGIKRQADLDDRQLFIKWTKEYGYQLDAILVAAKPQKRRGGMERLDRYIDELRAANAFSAEEVAAYNKNKAAVYDLAINIVKNIGGYYASMDIVIETYILPWLSKGFSYEGLLAIAKYCFLKGIKNLEGMDQLADRFFKQGLLNEESINNYIREQTETDQKITDIFEACNHSGLITNKEREFYRIWREWGFDDETILFVATLADKNPFPIQNINRNLALLYQNNIYDITSAKTLLEKDTAKRAFQKPVEEQGMDINKAIDIINSRRSLAELKAFQLLSSLREDKDFAAIESKIDELNFEIAKREALNKNLGNLKQQQQTAKEDYEKVLSAKGLTPADLETKYTCAICNDTGFVSGQKCSCLKSILGE